MAGYATPVTYTGADKVTTTYCKFGSISEFIDGYWNFITSPGAPYKDWQKYENDAQGYLEYIAKAGYCPLPGYVEQVSRAIPEAVTLLGVTAEKPPEPAPAKSSAPPPPATATPSKPAWHDELSAKFLNRRSSPIQGIVLHDTAGSGTHNDTRYLSNPQDGRKVSVDFTVEKDGSIWKLCNHAGRATEWLGFKNAQVNAVTIGIEIVQTDKLTGPPYYPAVQVQLPALFALGFARNTNSIIRALRLTGRLSQTARALIQESFRLTTSGPPTGQHWVAVRSSRPLRWAKARAMMQIRRG